MEIDDRNIGEFRQRKGKGEIVILNNKRNNLKITCHAGLKR